MDELVMLEAIRRLENIEIQAEERHNIQNLNPLDPFEELSDHRFIHIFRLTKELCRFLINILEPFMKPKLRNTDLKISTRVLTALRFFASGSYQMDIGSNSYLGVSQASVSRSVKEVTDALNRPEILDNWVKFPTNFEELNRTRLRSLQHSHLNWNISSVNSNHGRGIRSGVRSPCTLARRRYGLVKIQAKLCRNSMEAMPHIQNAALLASDTCRKVFKDRRWNCSSIITAPFLTPDLTRATREQAYVYAISSAALTHTLARACSSGNLHQCTCAGKPNSQPEENFQWGGCGDNVRWASQFSKRFIDNVEKHMLVKKEKSKRAKDIKEENRIMKDEAAVINLHNNRVGRKVISTSLHTQCKCHGVSGSCNIKTCWKALPSMIEIGSELLHRYTTAKEVSKKGINHLEVRSSKGLGGSDQLLYISKSPDYCTRDEKLGSFGTVGRHCNVSSNSLDSCRILCCGRGYRTVVEEKIERCQCKFYNCCYVKCKICRTKTQVYECL